MGETKLVNAVFTFFMLASLMVLVPRLYVFVPMATRHTNNFATLGVRLILPALFILLVISAGVSSKSS